MIDIEEKKDCCGCNACYDACPKDAISLETDIEGFWYPKVDKAKCIDCGLCNRTCPILNIDKLKKNEFEKPICYAAINKNIEARFGSASGGIFSALAEQMYKEGGYVGGAIFDSQFNVKHYVSNNPSDLVRLRSSKYTQSHTELFFKEVKKLLDQGEKVLVCGTPCQMSALRSYLKKEYANLIIVDFICKNVVSPRFYSLYLDYWERKMGSKLTSVRFRDTEMGWNKLAKRLDFKNGKTVYSPVKGDIFAIANLGNIVSRPACYDCKFKGFPRMADITIADFWGVNNYPELKSLNDNAGISEVLLNNKKGQLFFEKCRSRLTTIPTIIEKMIPGNKGLIKSHPAPKADRDLFFRELSLKPIEEVVEEFFPTSVHKSSFKHKLKIFLRPFWCCLRYSKCHPSLVFKFISLNFLSKKVQTDWLSNGFIYPLPYSIIELQKDTKVELHGPLIVGAKRVKNSHLETRLLLQRGSRLVVNEHFHIGYGGSVELFYNSLLEVDNCGSNIGLTLICGKHITMHGHVSIGRDVSIRDTNGHLMGIDGFKMDRPVVIEDHVWLCSGCVISPGVKIKEGAVVGASSYVVQNVPAHSLVSGHPAKVVMKNITWML